MAKISKRKRGQNRILEEIKNQLVLQSERWGKSGYYTPLKLEEMVLEQCQRIKGDFLSEKSNLEYELQRIGSDKKECLIKLEKLAGYIKKADYAMSKHKRFIARTLDKLIGEKEKVLKIMGRVALRKPAVSLLIGDD